MGVLHQFAICVMTIAEPAQVNDHCFKERTTNKKWKVYCFVLMGQQSSWTTQGTHAVEVKLSLRFPSMWPFLKNSNPVSYFINVHFFSQMTKPHEYCGVTHADGSSFVLKTSTLWRHLKTKFITHSSFCHVWLFINIVAVGGGEGITFLRC